MLTGTHHFGLGTRLGSEDTLCIFKYMQSRVNRGLDGLKKNTIAEVCESNWFHKLNWFGLV